MAEAPQNLANHPKFPTSLVVYCTLHVVSIIVAVVSILLLVRGTYADAALVLLAVAIVLQGLTAVGGLTMARFYSLTLQDRIIRLEMRLRLERVLPDDLKTAAANLRLSHLIALRFASDEELPDLVRKTLDEKPEKAKWIKEQVKNWQGDHLRV